MKILLACNECDYTAWGSSEKELMSKIIMWNHVKVAHVETTERITKMYQILPDHFYKTIHSGATS